MSAVDTTHATPAAPLVEMRSVSRRFGGVQAVGEVTLELARGEIVGLLGHNGAGKSTLMKLLAGVHTLDDGEIRLEGRPLNLRSPLDARREGIEILHQNLALADNLDAAANLFLGRELVTHWGLLDGRAMERIAWDVLTRLNPGFITTDLLAPVANLSGGQRQAVAIARAVHFEARVLILDEPTAALGPEETQLVAQLIRRLAADGLGIFLVSHDLGDVFDLSDRVAVMKNGRLTAVRRTSEVTPQEVLELIVAGAG